LGDARSIHAWPWGGPGHDRGASSISAIAATYFTGRPARRPPITIHRALDAPAQQALGRKRSDGASSSTGQGSPGRIAGQYDRAPCGPSVSMGRISRAPGRLAAGNSRRRNAIVHEARRPRWGVHRGRPIGEGRRMMGGAGRAVRAGRPDIAVRSIDCGIWRSAPAPAELAGVGAVGQPQPSCLRGRRARHHGRRGPRGLPPPWA